MSLGVSTLAIKSDVINTLRRQIAALTAKNGRLEERNKHLEASNRQLEEDLARRAAIAVEFIMDDRSIRARGYPIIGTMGDTGPLIYCQAMAWGVLCGGMRDPRTGMIEVDDFGGQTPEQAIEAWAREQFAAPTVAETIEALARG